MLLEREAAARGVSVEELTRIEITEKARGGAGGGEDVLRGQPRPLRGRDDEAEALQQIVEGLGQQRQRERRSAFAGELRDRYPVEVLLEPVPPRGGNGARAAAGQPEPHR